MDAENRMKEQNKPDAIERAIAYGVDITLLIENLKLTPTERIERTREWVDFVDGISRRKHANAKAQTPRPVGILEALDRETVDYVIIGEIAAAINGLRYTSAVLEICYSRDEENLKQLVLALKPFEPRLRDADQKVSFQFDFQTLQDGSNFPLNLESTNLDLIVEVHGIGAFRDVLRNSESMTLYKRKRHKLSLDALIRAKRAAGRKKDLNALPELEALLELKKRGGS